MNTLCTFAAVALVLFSFGLAIADANQPRIDDVVTGSISRTPVTPSTYGLAYKPESKGY